MMISPFISLIRKVLVYNILNCFKFIVELWQTNPSEGGVGLLTRDDYIAATI